MPGSGKKVVIPCFSFPPDFGGGAARVEELARLFHGLDYDVTVVTALPRSMKSEAGGSVPRPGQLEQSGAIRVLRLGTGPFLQVGIVRRVAAYSLFALALLAHRGEFRGADLVLAVGPHPVVGLADLIVGRSARGPRVLEVSDLLPEGYGRPGSIANRLLAGFARMFRPLLCALSEGVTASNAFIAEAMRRYTQKPVLELHTPLRRLPHPAVRPSEQEGDARIVLYPGAFGTLQDVERLVGCAAAIRDLPTVRLLLIGEGELKARVVAEARKANVTNLEIRGAVPRDKMEATLGRTSLGLVPLSPGHPLVLQFAVPTKFYEFLQHEIPILCEDGGEMARLTRRFRCGVPLDFGDPQGFRDAVREVLFSGRYESYCAGAEDARRELVDSDLVAERLRGFLRQVEAIPR